MTSKSIFMIAKVISVGEDFTFCYHHVVNQTKLTIAAVNCLVFCTTALKHFKLEEDPKFMG